MKRSLNLSKAATIAGWILGILLSVPLLMHSYFGVYSRYLADDFCTAGSLRELGYIQSQVFWYNTWSGRYAFTLVINTLEVLGPWITRIMPAMIIYTWLIGSVLLIRKLAEFFDRTLPYGLSFGIAVLAEFAVLSGVGNPVQSIYWLTGIVTYSLPFVLLLFTMFWLIKLDGKKTTTRGMVKYFIAVFLVSFFIGGFSETFAAVQVTLYAGFFLFQFIWPKSIKNDRLAMIGSGLLGAITAVVVIIIAPGNAARAGFLPEPPDLFLLIDRTWLDFKIFISRILKQEFAILLLTLIAPAALIVARRSRSGQIETQVHKKLLIGIVGLPFFTVLLILASIMPYEYGISSYPDDRVLVIARVLLYTAVTIWSAGVGILWSNLSAPSHKWMRSLAMPIILMAVIVGMREAYVEVLSSVEITDRLRDFAGSWDERHNNLTELDPEVGVPVEARSLTHMGGLAEIGYDPDEWINRCVAQTYGLEQVVAK